LLHKIGVNPLSAVDKKVFSTTNERKVMSNKTFFKRIALTAIAALGFGMLSVAPSQATVTAHTLTIDNAADTIEVNETATAVLTHSFVNLSSGQDSVTLQALVTSSNASSAGTIRMTITDSYTSNGVNVAADTTMYQFGGSGVPAQVSNYGNGAVSGIGLSSNSNTVVDSMTISNATPNRAIGTVINLKLINPTRAGTYTVTVYTLASNAGATAVSATPTATWTVTVTAIAETAAATNSTATLRQNNASALRGSGTYFGGTAEGTDSQTLSSATSTTTDLTPEFTMLIWQKDGTSTNLAKESYTVQVTGEAFVTAGTDIIGGAVASYATGTRPLTAPSGANTVTGTKYLRMATPVADSPTAVHIWSTGTAGTATITATSNAGVVLGTKTVTFAGKATTLAVTTTTKKVIEAGTGTASTAAFRVTATDSGGRNVPGISSIVIVSDNIAAIASGSCADASGAVTDGVYSCDLNPVVTSTSGAAAALTIRMPDPAVTTATAADGPYLTTTYNVTMGGAWKTMVLTTDKASYDPGTAMVVTATLKDSSGNTPYDGQAGPTLRANKQLGGTAAGTTITMNAVYDGVSTSQTRSSVVRTMSAETTLFAPAASGAFNISGLDAQTTPTSVSVSATVGDDGATAAANAASDAAAEAIDAANAATDAANLAAEAADAATVAAEEARDAADAATAAVEALATEVATLMAALKAQITTLANTVAKIAKKVKA
jgi:hypothetical protein